MPLSKLKVLIAPDKFKGSLTALEVSNAIKSGLQRSNTNLEFIIHPLADGGDGSITILKDALDLKSRTTSTIDPLGRPMQAEYFVSDDAAFIEMASASGLVLLEKSERNPLVTNSRGTGLMIKEAIDRGFKKIYLFLGGSATNDGGIGIAHALGVNFLDQNGHQLEPSGHNLINIKSIDTKGLTPLKDVEIILLCDVTNPMHGPTGAAHVFGPQKGGEKWAIDKLDEGLKNYDLILQNQMGKDLSSIPGMGAAGAIGASLVGLCGAYIKSGFDMIAKITDFESALHTADYVISGEGKLDTQSIDGKVVSGVAQLCQKHSKPLYLFVGKNDLDGSYKSTLNYREIRSIAERAKNLDDAMNNAESYLKHMASELEL